MSRRSAMGILPTLAAVAVIAWVVSSGSVERGGIGAVIWCVAAAFAINWAVFVPSWLKRSEVFFDLTGSITYLVCTALALALAEKRTAASWLMAGLVGVWAARLGSFLYLRIRAAGHDGRFDRIKTDFGRLLLTWTMQAMWVSLTALAAWTAITATGGAPFTWVTAVGLVVWIFGFAIEVVADNQKRVFARDPANRSKFIATGLWERSRHPNYFGEITLWVGMALMALPALGGRSLLALISPLFVWLLLVRLSGIPLLEKRALKRWGDDPDYLAYLEATPELVPRLTNRR